MKLDDYLSDEILEQWPKAVEEASFDPKERCQRIVDLFIGHKQLENTAKYLDFGCGSYPTGKLTKKHGVKTALNYDIQPYPNVINDFEIIKASAPFDTILLYDVIDHMSSPEVVLEELKSLLSPEGKLFIRCHPFSSRNGGHLSSNKAYMHLFLPGEQSNCVNQWLYAKKEYYRIFHKCQLSICLELINVQEVESFFLEEPICELFSSCYRSLDSPIEQIAPYYIDYILSSKPQKFYHF
jgi:SAM-dependent methyltransferase